MAKTANNNWLIFVDSNIWLDFYRRDGTDALKQLTALRRHRDRLILTDQVFMEVLKNRQKVISDTIKEMKRPESVRFAPVLQEFLSANTIQSDLDGVSKKIKQMESRILKIFEKPREHDPVFKSLSEIFESTGPYFLKRDDPTRFTIRRLAQKRFFLGYPPRKKEDVSIGDALNWEWIVRCAETCAKKSHVLIVTRDGDFGARRDKSSYLNDWLAREFRERVSKERKIILTARLTDALKRLNEAVTKREEEEEAKFLLSEDVADEEPNIFS